MQAHLDDRIAGPLLDRADAADTLSAWGARLRVQAQANTARLLRGYPPLALPSGPATPHEVVDDGPLARLLRYPAVGTRAKRPVLIVASLINRFYVLDLLP